MNSHCESYEKIKLRIESFGYRVLNTNCDSWDSSTKTVCNNSKRRVDNRSIHLLHELGHIYVFKKSNYKNKFAHLIENKLTIRFMVSEIEQEVLAWNMAEQLAPEFGVKVDNQFYKCKFESLRTYIE